MKQKTIQIDVDPNSIGLNRPVDVGILADAKSALKAILSSVKAKTQARTEMADLARYRELTQQTQVQGFQFLMAQPTQGVNPGQVVFNPPHSNGQLILRSTPTRQAINNSVMCERCN